MPGHELRLSVDLGTSTTVAVLAQAERVRPLLFDGSPLLPSAVFVDADGEMLTGRDALHAARSRPESVEPHPKRCLDQGTVLLGSWELPVADVLAAILRRVLAEAVRSTGGAVPGVILTHPAGWGPRRRAVLVDAAVRAGMEPIGLVAEPSPASYFATVAGLRLGPDEGLWNVRSWQKVRTLPVQPGVAGDWTKVEFSPADRYLWTSAKGVAQLWDTATGQLLVPAFTDGSGARARFSSDSRFLAVTSFSGTRMWDLAAVLAAGG